MLFKTCGKEIITYYSYSPPIKYKYIIVSENTIYNLLKNKNKIPMHDTTIGNNKILRLTCSMS
jgi:hypothetical protein